MSEITSKKPIQRIISFDYMRGWAIIGVLGFHVLNVMYDYEARLELDYIPFAYYLLFAFLVFVGGFFPLFILVSAVGNTISMDKKFNRIMGEEKKIQNLKSRQILVDQLMRGGLLIVFGYIAEVLLNGYLLNMIIPLPQEQWSKAFRAFYHSQILSMIGWGVIFCALLYVIFRNKGMARQSIQNAFLFLAVAVVILTPIFELIARNAGFYETYANYQDHSVGENIGYFILAQFMGGWFPLFPNVAASFLGMYFGLAVSDGKVEKQFLSKNLMLSVICAVASLVVFFLIENTEITQFLMSTAGSLVLIVIVFYFIEVRGKGTKFGTKTVGIRRFGNLTLSLWCLQWVMVLFLHVIHLFINLANDTDTRFINGPIYTKQLDGYQSFGVFVIITATWYLLLWLWEKVDYKGSLEWLTGKIMSKGKKGGDEREGLAYSLYHVESLITEGQEFYSRGQKIGLFVLFFGLMILNVALLLL